MATPILKQAVTLLLLLLLGTANAQTRRVDRFYYLDPDTRDFATIQEVMEGYFREAGTGKGTGYKQWKRWEYDNRTRLGQDGEIINYARITQDEYERYNAEQDGRSMYSPIGNWSFMGPTGFVNGYNGYAPGLGRLNVIAFHPVDANTVYVGAPAGGLWRTTDGGTSWACLTESFPNLGISGIAINPADPDIIHVLTGDGDGHVTPSLGVYRSTDGGTTWTASGPAWSPVQSIRGYKLLMSPANPDVLLMVTTAGVFRTSNGGSTWTNTLANASQDIEVKPGDPNTLYVTADTALWRSSDAGITWSHTFTIPGASRMAIAVSPNTPNDVYLLAGPSTGVGSFKGFWRSTDSGQSFTLKTSTPNILGYETNGQDNENQATYDLALAVSPTNGERILAGGITTWLSQNGGTSFTWNTHWYLPGMAPGPNYIHCDIHDIAFNPLNGHVYCATDGGLAKSTDAGATWGPLYQGLNTAMFYRIADHDPDPGLFIGGTQDNGSNKLSGGNPIMTHMTGADGMDCMIDHSNPNIIYYTWQNGTLHRSNDGGTQNQVSYLNPGVGPWVTPLAMDPMTPTTLYGAWKQPADPWFHLYKSTNSGNNWTKLTPFCSEDIAICKSHPQRIYASALNVVSTSADGGATWLTYYNGSNNILPQVTNTGLAVNPQDPMEVYMTVAGYLAGQKVYRSTDAGATWTNITGTLPNISVNCIAYDGTGINSEDQLYLGTDVGVFYRDNTLGDWVPYNVNLPAVRVEDIKLNEMDGSIAIGTFGRGIWRSELYRCLNTLSLSGNAPAGVSLKSAGTIVSNASITAGGTQEVFYKGGHTIELDPPFKVLNNSKFNAVIDGCGDN